MVRKIESFIISEEKMKYKCPCCENYTLYEKPPGTYEICDICHWEDDLVQYNDPTYKGGANILCLNDAKKNYKMRNNMV